MNKTLTRLFTVALLMMVSLGAKADVKVLYGKTGNDTFTGGKISARQEVQKDGQVAVTFTIKPDNGYTFTYTKTSLVIVSVYDPSSKSGTRADEIKVSETLWPKGTEGTIRYPNYGEYTVTVDPNLGVWVQTVVFTEKNRDTKNGSNPDYSGTYYIATVTHSDNPADNYYLCPTENWYYDNSNEYTSTNTGKPFLTTYQCRGTAGYESKAIWVIQKHPTSNYYYIKHGSQYLTYNIAYFTNTGRVRVHLEDNPADDDYALFAINYHSSSNSYEIISKYADDNDTYKDGNKERKYLNINKGNKQSLKGSGDKVDNIDTGGIIGLWSAGADESQGTGRFYLEEYIPRPSISSPSSNQIVVSHSDENMTIYYTIDGTNPSTEQTENKGDAPLQIEMPENAVTLKTIAAKKSDNLPSCISSIRVVPSATVTLTPSSFTYNGSAQEPTVTVKDGNTTISSDEYTVGYSDNTDAGDATVTITDVTNGDYIVYGSTTFTISPKPLTITANPKTITYGDAPANNGVTYGEFAGTETSEVLTGTLAYAYNYERYGNVGDYAITPSGLSNDNYDITFVNGTLTVNPKELTVTAKPHTITYGDEPANRGVTYTGFVEGENENIEGMFTGTLDYAYNSAADGSGDAYMTTSNVGSYFIIPSGLTATNYEITFENGTLTVNRKEVGIEWSNTSLPYNGSEQKPTATATGLVNNDEIGVTVTTDREAIAIADDYTATADGLTGDKAGNYKLPTPKPERSFEITKAVLTITAKPHTITYGDEPNNDGVTYESSIVNDNVDGIEFTGELDYDYTYERYGDVSDAEHTYTITPKGLTSMNYSITYNAGTLTVEPKEVGLTWSSPTTFTYNGREQAPTANATGMVNGDEIGVTVTGGKANASTESYTATASALTGTKAGNYKLPDDATQTFSINKATLKATADDVDIIYGDEAPTAYTISYTGFVNDEDKTAITTPPTAACTYIQGDDAGDYDITVSDDGVAENYEFAVVNGTLTVGPKTVSDPTIEISETSFEYDGTDKEPVVTLVKDGETEIPSDQYQWSWSNNIYAAESTDENPPTVTVTNIENGNYTISGTVTFTITPKSIGNGTASAEGFVISFDDSENVTITCPIENLTKDADYTVSGPTEENGIQMWTISGIGNYSGGAKVMRIVLDFYDTGAATGENVQDVATFQASSDMVISGKDVYIVTDVNLTKNKVVLSKIAYAPKDEPVLLLTDLEGTDPKTTAGVAATPILVETGDEADTSGNIFKRVSEAGGLQVAFAKVFMFYIGKFVLTTEGTLETGTYYFDNPNPPSSSVAGSRLSIVIDETTDIDGIKEYDNTGTVIDRWYSLDGRRLNGKPTRKGLYIKNGQKVVIK